MGNLMVYGACFMLQVRVSLSSLTEEQPIVNENWTYVAWCVRWMSYLLTTHSLMKIPCQKYVRKTVTFLFVVYENLSKFDLFVVHIPIFSLSSYVQTNSKTLYYAFFFLVYPLYSHNSSMKKYFCNLHICMCVFETLSRHTNFSISAHVSSTDKNLWSCDLAFSPRE